MVTSNFYRSEIHWFSTKSIRNWAWAVAIASVLILQIGSFGLITNPLFPKQAAAITQVVFEENFDSGLSGWTQSECIIHDASQTCEINTAMDHGGIPPPSPPNWGFVQVLATSGICSPEVRVKYEKTFTVPSEDDYDLSATIATVSCDVCRIFAQLFLDSKLIFDIPGKQRNIDPPPFVTSSFEQTTVHLLPGTHTIEMGMRSPFGACSGGFRGTFDNIIVQHEIPDTTPPVISLLGKSPIDVECGSVYTDAGATAFDDVDGDLTSSIVVNNPVNTNVLGTYLVSYDVSDSSGNAATTVTRMVNVVDTMPPVATASLLPLPTADNDYDEVLFEVVIGANDACDPNPTLTADINGISVVDGQIVKLELDDDMEVEDEDGILTIEAPSFTLTAVATDVSGNTATATATPTFGGEEEEDDDNNDDNDNDNDNDDNDNNDNDD